MTTYGNDLSIGASAGLGDTRISEKDREATMRVVAGSRSCRGSDDARELLQALGLIPYIVVNNKIEEK